MKVLILNGSPKPNGNVSVAVNELAKTLGEQGIETETIHIGNKMIRGCIACNKCAELGKCVFDNDPVNETAKIFEEADGLVIASPVYYASANATLIALLDRLFYSVARRGGCSATFDELNKYFTISGMPVASSTYWNSVHGMLPGEAQYDAEGLKTMRVLARNMAFLIKSIALGKEKFGLPENEPWVGTHFIRDDLKK